MPFNKADSKVPTSLGKLKIILVHDPLAPLFDPQLGKEYLASYEIEVLDQDGQQIRVPGDFGNLISELSQTEQTQLQTFVQNQRSKAEKLITG